MKQLLTGLCRISTKCKICKIIENKFIKIPNEDPNNQRKRRYIIEANEIHKPILKQLPL